MNLYIDFDNTLFNTVLFYHDLGLVLAKYDITFEVLTKYADNPLILLQKLAHKVHDPNFLKIIDDYFQKAYKYVYPDSLRFLKRVSNKYHLILLTYGDYDYQWSKIKASKVGVYFDDIIITPFSKETLNLAYQTSIFIDDNAEVIRKLLTKSPKKIIRLKRRNNPHNKDIIHDSLVVEYDNMDDIIL